MDEPLSPNNINEKPGLPDAELPLAVAGAERVRWCARMSAALIMAACAFAGGPLWKEWVWGAFLGGLAVEINLSLLALTLAKAPAWKGRSLWPTLIKFYLAFGATIIFCVLVVRNQWGHPLAFLLGLLSFFTGLALGLTSMAVKKPKSGSDAKG